MRTLDCQTRQSALHVTLALVISTLMIAGIAEEAKKRKAVESYLRALDTRIERVEASEPARPVDILALAKVAPVRDRCDLTAV